MNCLYCQKETMRIDEHFHRCLPCYTDFHKNHISISTRYKNKTWVVVHRLLPFKYPTVIGNAWEPEFLMLETRANITPQNIKEKLKTYLLFS